MIWAETVTASYILFMGIWVILSCKGIHILPLYFLQFIFSTAIDGKIKAWLYDNMGSRVDYDAPGRWCTTMLYSADGSRSVEFQNIP